MLNTRTEHFNKIVLSTMEGYYPVNPADIIYCRADDCYTHIYMQDGKTYTISKLLKEFERLLEPHNFFRIHKSFLINLNHIEKIAKADGVSVTMSNRKELPVSFRKKEQFINRIKSY